MQRAEPDDVFHAGEQYAQQKAGAREKLAELGPRVIRDYMPDQHREFFTLLPWLLVGSVDAQGQPWASVLTGIPGFVVSPDVQHLHIAAQPLAGDPLRENLRPGVPVGLLGLQSHTRRRNRMNGVVDSVGEQGVAVHVQQSFGNCPKYIQAREAKYSDWHTGAAVSEHLSTLDTAATALIGSADTFFIATTHPVVTNQVGEQLSAAEGVDISHRGGRPGFIRVVDNTLLVPDYTGNFFFNTIGNLLLEPRAGLLFFDFVGNNLLQVSVKVDVVWNSPELSEFPDARRLLRMQVTDLIRHRNALPLEWGAAKISPFL
jgi:predicted pyridoxine 5'-phosphate oxidase superfamily flavin-nucleotide-binding protein